MNLNSTIPLTQYYSHAFLPAQHSQSAPPILNMENMHPRLGILYYIWQHIWYLRNPENQCGVQDVAPPIQIWRDSQVGGLFTK